MNQTAIAAVLLAAIWTTGCNKEREFPPVFPVSGTLVHNGRVVDRAQVIFVPVDKKDMAAMAACAFGKTDQNGRFEMSTYLQGDGVAPGEHVVTVYWPQKGATIADQEAEAKGGAVEDLAPDQFGGKYARPEKSPLRATVREVPNQIDLSLP